MNTYSIYVYKCQKLETIQMSNKGKRTNSDTSYSEILHSHEKELAMKHKTVSMNHKIMRQSSETNQRNHILYNYIYIEF